MELYFNHVRFQLNKIVINNYIWSYYPVKQTRLGGHFLPGNRLNERVDVSDL